VLEQIIKFFGKTGYANISLEQAIMILIACFLMYLAVAKKYEPLLLVPISFGMLLANIPQANLTARTTVQ
jgi:Na+-transporting methylmalonyl-CoA/oxaloacetate decarboxylase beta subunit